ncbi:hypothetical protein MMC29_000635 [Sticta canariensis]|nr:hypothetical protein [Sticta canariensis]
MKTHFKFTNLLGTVYCNGNILFTPDGTCLISPVGNRVTVFDLINNKSCTLPFAHRWNICRSALTPNGNILITVDEAGHAILTNFPRRLALYHFSFKGAVTALIFSPSSRYLAVGIGRFVQVWHTPSTPDINSDEGFEFSPFVLHREYAGHYDIVRHLQWSSDSRFFLSAAKDLTSRIWSLNPEQDFTSTVLSGHRESLLGAWFSSDQETIYTISEDGALFQWSYCSKSGIDNSSDVLGDEDAIVRWRITQRHFFMQSNAKVNCATYHASTNLFVAGFSNGLFGLYELPAFNMIHTLSISQNEIAFVTVNKSGEWLAFGSSKMGQLLVWEWQSESYILKQQGHFDTMNALAYSPDGQRIITASDDGKIKVWDTQSGFCVVTFTEHSGGVTACEFAKRGNVLFSASLDGSIRAWDLIRYRNFKTFTSPMRLSFSSMAVDPSGEVVCATSLDSFEIYIWSVQTGQLLDQLSGHEGPVTSLAFAPSGSILVSGSWDHTVRIWSIFGRSQTSEPLQLHADVLRVAVRADSKQVAISTLDGQLTFWSISEAIQESGVDGRRDISGGRRLTDRRAAANASGTKAFNSLTYSSDGTCIIASGNSKYICLYDVQSGALVNRFVVSINLSLSGTQEFLNSHNLTDVEGEGSNLEHWLNRTMPGTKRGDISSRQRRPEVRVPAIAFSPTGRAFCAVTTEGLLVFSLDNIAQFDPFDLEITITPTSILQSIDEKDYLKAFVMAFRLNEKPLIRLVYEKIPLNNIALALEKLPTVYLAQLMRFVAEASDENPHLEFNLIWVETLLRVHGQHIKDRAASFSIELRTIQKAVARFQVELARMTDDNIYTLDYFLSQPITAPERQNKMDIAMTHDCDGILEDSEEAETEWLGIDDEYVSVEV